MKPFWLLQDNIFDENLWPLMRTITEHSMEYSVIKYKPFCAMSISEFYEHYDYKSCVITYGSINLINRIKHLNVNWTPGYFANFDDYKCSKYYSKYGSYLLNQDYIMLPSADIYRHYSKLHHLFDFYNNTYSLFIRPDSGLKDFSGKVFNISDKFQLTEHILNQSFDDIVVISSPKEIHSEYRLVIADKKPISYSRYKLNGNFDIAHEILVEYYSNGIKKINSDFTEESLFNFAEKMANIHSPSDRVYIMDIAIQGGDYRLIELNSFSCSGLYKCNMEPIVKEVARIAEEEYNLVH